MMLLPSLAQSCISRVLHRVLSGLLVLDKISYAQNEIDLIHLILISSISHSIAVSLPEILGRGVARMHSNIPQLVVQGAPLPLSELMLSASLRLV